MIENNFYIRRADNNDITDIQYLVFGVLISYGLIPEPDGKDKDLQNIEKNYTHNDGFFGVLIFKETNNIIGTFGIAKYDDQLCELRKMYLNKEFRRKGLGEYMLQHALDKAIELSYKKIILETISPLKEAISLYVKYGFTEFLPKLINSRVDRAFELQLKAN